MPHLFLSSQDEDTPLHLAALGGHAAVVEKLLTSGASTEAKSKVKMRVGRGADGGGSGEQDVSSFWVSSCAFDSLSCAHVEMSKWIAGAAGGGTQLRGEGWFLPHIFLSPQDDHTPLQFAAMHGHEAVAEKLLAAGASTEAKSKVRGSVWRGVRIGEGRGTAHSFSRDPAFRLNICFAAGCPAILGYCYFVDRTQLVGDVDRTPSLERGPDTEAQFFMASCFGGNRFVFFGPLWRYGTESRGGERRGPHLRGMRVRVSERCHSPQLGNTPLHHAARQGHVVVVEQLLLAGADKEAKGKVRREGGGRDVDRGGGVDWGNTKIFFVVFSRCFCFTF